MITINSEIEFTAQDKQFIDFVNKKITLNGQIPYSIPQPIVVEQIKQSARIFYRYYWKAQKVTMYRLTKDSILDFQRVVTPGENPTHVGRVFFLPSYVSVVKAIYQTNKSTLSNLSTGEIQTGRNITNRMYGINNSLYAIEAACVLVEQGAFNAVFGRQMPFHYNNLISQLEIYDNIEDTLILECLSNIPIQYLYNDDLYIRHVLAELKKDLKRIIGSHTIELPGNAIMNVDEICNNLEDSDKVEEILKASSGIGDIILTSD